MTKLYGTKTNPGDVWLGAEDLGTAAPAALPVGPVGHTPGPWRCEEGTTLIWGDCIPDDPTTRGMGYPIAECRVRLGRYGDCQFRYDEATANAALIASAPDMADQIAQLTRINGELVEACQQAEAALSIVEPRSDKAEYLRILGVVRAALKSATEDR